MERKLKGRVTPLDPKASPTIAIPRLYHEQADAENVIDTFKNQSDWMATPMSHRTAPRSGRSSPTRSAGGPSKGKQPTGNAESPTRRHPPAEFREGRRAQTSVGKYQWGHPLIQALLPPRQHPSCRTSPSSSKRHRRGNRRPELPGILRFTIPPATTTHPTPIAEAKPRPRGPRGPRGVRHHSASSSGRGGRRPRRFAGKHRRTAPQAPLKRPSHLPLTRPLPLRQKSRRVFIGKISTSTNLIATYEQKLQNPTVGTGHRCFQPH
jgi:hypothetical protein